MSSIPGRSVSFAVKEGADGARARCRKTVRLRDKVRLHGAQRAIIYEQLIDVTHHRSHFSQEL